jgi:hypothetical protein
MRPNYARLFAEAVRDSVRDHARDNPQTILTGLFVGKLRRRGPDIPASIEQIDHEPGEPDNKLDTGPIFIATIGLDAADPLDVMAMRRRRAIDQAEYDYRMARLAWARDYAPHEPEARPDRAVDLRRIPAIGPEE